MLRQIVKIDEAKCNGCGLCVPACAEGAIAIIDGKARLVSDVYCDGLGACLGDCPQGAITMEEREATPFDEHAAEIHVTRQKKAVDTGKASNQEPSIKACPGVAAQMLQPAGFISTDENDPTSATIPSALTNWPVQIALAPIRTPYFEDADMLLVGDCVPFAFADFHRQFVTGRTLLMGCPKLDDADMYRQKLARIFAENNIRSIRVLYMEVPCCFGLVHLVKAALEESGKDIPLVVTKINIRGEICETHELQKT